GVRAYLGGVVMIDYHRFCQIKHLHAHLGLTASQIAKELALDPRTVAYWLGQEHFRPRKSTPRSSKLDQIPPDLVVKSQAIDIIGLILSLIKRKTSLTTSRRPRKSSFGCSHYPRVIGLPLNSMESGIFRLRAAPCPHPSGDHEHRRA